jgi:transposase
MSVLDVHNDAIAVADVAPAHGAAVTSLGTIGTRQGALEPLIGQRPSQATHLILVDEAGPCGDWRSRDLPPTGHGCWVVAPSLLPKTAGARVNTDRRDARQRARLMRSGDWTPVDVPQVAAAAIRALTRARADPIRARNAATCRLKAFVCRHDLRDTARTPWRAAHRRGRSAVGGPTPAPPSVCQASGCAVTAHTDRRQRLAQARHAQGTSWRLPPVVAALQARRGVPCTGAVTTLAARGAPTRVATPRPLLTCLGLMPSDSARGARRRQGASTPAGTTQARRALVAGA